jgi:hypothetical protein
VPFHFVNINEYTYQYKWILYPLLISTKKYKIVTEKNERPKFTIHKQHTPSVPKYIEKLVKKN